MERFQQNASAEENEVPQRFVIVDTSARNLVNVVRLEALQERIGTVNTSLNRETIMARLNRYEYRAIGVSSSHQKDRCCICLDDYVDGQDIGKLNCDHEFHSGCIAEWLVRKNSCPICQRRALTS